VGAVRGTRLGQNPKFEVSNIPYLLAFTPERLCLQSAGEVYMADFPKVE
jgi:hypothetical protein